MATSAPVARRGGTIAKVVAGVVAAAGLATAAVAVDGYDSQDVPRLALGVWVLRADGQYARVNTALGEIDTVRTVADPSGVVQAGDRAVVYSNGLSRAWEVDGAAPAALVSATDADQSSSVPLGTSIATPAGTTAVAVAGDYLAYRTSAGEVFVGTMPDPGQPPTSPGRIDPFALVEVPEGEDPPVFVATAIALRADGTVAAFSALEQAVRVYDASQGEWRDPVPVESAPEVGEPVEMTFAGDAWVLAAPGLGELWWDGGGRAQTGLAADALLQAHSSPSPTVVLADSASLVSVDTDSGAVETIANVSGTPAAPVIVDGTPYGAWLTAVGGTLVNGATGAAIELPAEDSLLADSPQILPVFRTNGDRAVLTETSTGMLWTVPDGAPIPTEQWQALEETEVTEGTVTVTNIVESRPPTAVPDAFGVRAGSVVSLPLLLNDYDPNKDDVLSIDSAALGDLDPSFGALRLVDDDQRAVVDVRATSGTQTFDYAVTDGFSSSPTASVTLTVVPPDVNTAPVWCGVVECTQPVPTMQVAPGGYASLPVLETWVDPEGDPIVLADAYAADPNAPVTVVPTADGRVVVRHRDPNAGGQTLTLVVEVADSRGATETQEFDLFVVPTPALEVEPVTVTAALGAPISVDVSEYISGGSGSYRLIDAALSVGRDSDVTIVPNVATGTVSVQASQPGRYAATYTIEDTVTLAQRSATLRVTVPDDAQRIAIAPLTAFVRVGEDTTVDILDAVQNSTGRLLLVSEAVSQNARLSVSTVGNQYVRVSAASGDDTPGLVGVADVVVADGVGNRANTQLTVFLLPSERATSPIAAPDVASVRAGGQIDVPVLDNDVSPRGQRMVLHPDVTGSGAAGELVFASGSQLRYLAPEVPGTYVVHYSVYAEGDPERTDSATLTVTVTSPGANRAPEPPVLEARVNAGQSVVIPLSDTGVDPDGDDVRIVDVVQPSAGGGAATVSAAGDAVTYYAPEGGVPSGQATFGYVVTDGELTTEGLVRVGVLADDVSDVAPVTYGDYVSASLGSDAPVTVLPLLNDRDPGQGALALIGLKPNALPGSEEYARLEALIDPETDLGAASVKLLAGDVAGTHSYVYTVESDSTFSTAEGLIVVNVSDSPAPDAITVDDTSITARNRTELATGIDVVTDRVRWTRGDVDEVVVELLPGAPEEYQLFGNAIAGPLPDEPTIIPFAVVGTAPDGDEVRGYGFLRIPTFEDMRLELRATLNAIQVGEEETVEFSLYDVLDLAPGDSIEVRADDSFPVQRGAARCVPTSATTVSYAAGREAPWSDMCAVAVRLGGQETWSTVPVPIDIQPKAPQAGLRPVSRTVPPGESDAVDVVASMVTWEGGRLGDVDALALETSYSGQWFVVERAGDSVSIQARADAPPGARETIAVTSSAHGGLRSSITLVVGAAIPDAPRGAVFTHQCDVSRGSTCLITAVGVSGEYDPFAGKPGAGLSVETVGTSGSVVCPAATVTVANGNQLKATWPSGSKPVGGECVVDFTVVDAQGRTGYGQVTLDILGYPQTPASLVTTSYTGTSVTVRVDIGNAAQAHPAVTGVQILEDGVALPASCVPSGPSAYSCTITGWVNGDEHRLTARVVNSVGASLDTTVLETWAYQPPTISSVSAVAVLDEARTSGTHGVAEVTVTASDDTQDLRFVANGETVSYAGPATSHRIQLPVGPQSVAVVPISEFRPPIGSDNTGAAASASVTVAGAPVFTGSLSVTGNPNSVDVSGGGASANYSTQPVSTVWFAYVGAAPTCAMATDGSAVVTGAVATSSTSTVSGLVANTDYKVAVCAANGFAATRSAVESAFTWEPPAAPAGPLEYTVATSWSVSGNTYSVGYSSFPSITVPDKFTLYYQLDGASKSESFPNIADNAGTVTAMFCATAHPNMCGPTTDVTASAGSPVAPVTVVLVPWGSCVTDEPNNPVSISDRAEHRHNVTTTDDADHYYVNIRFQTPSYSMLDDIDQTYDKCVVEGAGE